MHLHSWPLLFFIIETVFSARYKLRPKEGIYFAQTVFSVSYDQRLKKRLSIERDQL
jgi:hypothetical protein